jgi:hypothetical protein
MSSMQLPSGAMDLIPESTVQDAHSAISSAIHVFTSPSSSSTHLSTALQASQVLLQPIVDALVSEGGRAVGTPCFDLPAVPGCIQSSPFSIHAQTLIGQIAGNYDLSITDIMWQSERFYPHDYVPKCGKDASGKVTALTVTEQAYNDIAGSNFISASEISIKLVSVQAIKVASGIPAGDYDTEDGTFTW